MVILLKENDIKDGLLWDDYINWCILFNRTQLYSVKGYDEITKEELNDYFIKKKYGSLRPK